MTNDNPNINSSKTQMVLLIESLLRGFSPTPLDASEMWGCTRLASRVTDLKNDYGIVAEREFIKLPSGKRVKRYWLTPNQRAALRKMISRKVAV